MSGEILVKISGDLIGNPAVIAFLKKLQADTLKELNFTALVGGGSEINRRLDEAGIFYAFKDGVRHHYDDGSRRVAREVLERNAERVEESFDFRHVLVPYHYVGTKLCHFNGDDYLRMLAPSFNNAYCLTVKGRKKDFPEAIKVVEFDKEES